MDSSIALGTPAHMLRRNEHPDTSDQAAREFNTSRGEARVLAVVLERWERRLDTIGDDVLEHYGVSDQREHAVSESGYKARFSALQRKGYVCLTGDRRDGHRFGKSQQCWRPMTDDERESFLEGRRNFENVVIDDYILEKVVAWCVADTALKKAMQEEQQRRVELVESLLYEAPLGKYEFDLPQDVLLTIELQSNGESKVKSVAMTERQRTMRLRRIAEREASRIAPVQDTVDLSSFYKQ